MIEFRVGAAPRGAPLVLALRGGDALAAVAPAIIDDAALAQELAAFIADVDHRGAAGAVQVLPRPGRRPNAVLLVGVGGGATADWRAAGAALVRAASTRWPAVHVRLPDDVSGPALRAFFEAGVLASYRFRLVPDTPPTAVSLRRITVDGAASVVTAALNQASATTDAVALARDLTNAPSRQKSPKWFADRVSAAAARRPGVSVTVHDKAELQRSGFGGLLAVGAGSPRPPNLFELAWRPAPRRGRRPVHVVLVGKGITFDSGGISLKPKDAMKLMRKDMGGAAAVCAAVLAVADLALPVRVTALAPLAENLVSGTASRPGDVIRHFGGLTTEIQNTDAEGRVVLGDALAYAVRRLRPDVLVDLATLTGAARVALGKRTAALFSHDDELAGALVAAGDEVGERMWRLPLTDDYVGLLASDVADLNNSPGQAAGAGAIAAALYLREFTGDLRAHWAHIDMSAPSWAESNDGLLVKGATGWGVRMLIQWLSSM